MAEMTLAELVTLLRECAGVEDGVDLDGDILDVLLADLGYDSLAVLQVAGRVERDYGAVLSDEATAEADTPRKLLDVFNDGLSVTVRRAS